MFTTIIVSTDRPEPQLLTEITQITRLEHNPDVIWVIPEEEKSSISIDQVHLLQRELSLKPFHEDRKLAIISPAHLLSLPAQQAMLKLLEEPPENTQIILATSLPNKLLPTILSRGNLVHVEKEDKEASENSLYEELTKLSVSASIKKSDEWSKSREEAITKLQELLLEIRGLYLKSPTTELLNHEKAVIVCIEQLERNVNAKLALDHLFFVLNGMLH